MSEYLGIYLFGSALSVFLGVVSSLVGYVISWLTKDNVVRKNLNKIEDPKSYGFKLNAGLLATGLVTGAIMSWLGVLLNLAQIVWMPLKIIRELLFSSVPEEIKQLSFPLKNNPYLAREAVFAYFYALRVKTGVRPNAWEISDELNTIAGYYPSFDKVCAINTLESLGVVDKETISNALAYLREEEDDA